MIFVTACWLESSFCRILTHNQVTLDMIQREHCIARGTILRAGHRTEDTVSLGGARGCVTKTDYMDDSMQMIHLFEIQTA